VHPMPACWRETVELMVSVGTMLWPGSHSPEWISPSKLCVEWETGAWLSWGSSVLLKGDRLGLISGETADYKVRCDCAQLLMVENLEIRFQWPADPILHPLPLLLQKCFPRGQPSFILPAAATQ
jgi:hypothetical protein